jgi:hypothetical protein
LFFFVLLCSSLFFFDLCFDDHGSFVIFRSVSVRPRHLFDLYFDHDYFFKLPLQGAGCPIMWTAFYFTPCPVPSCPAYEPNSNDCEYSQPFRHIQYKRTPSLRRGRVRHRAQGTPLSLGQRPNELWCTDYKGEFLLGNHQYCYPLTVTDHASRFLLTRIEVLSCAILVSYK